MVAGWSSAQRSSTDSLPAQAAAGKRSLASIVRDHGPLSVEDAVDITLDLCEALVTAHANGVVHGDLGLHHVQTTWPRVPGSSVDIFVLAENDSAAFAYRSSARGVLVAPEQRGGLAVDVRADIWAVGAIFHWLLAGAPPSRGAVAQKLAHVPRAIVACVEACLAERPSDRPSSVDAIAEAIGSFASSPAERFERLAGRRAARAHASRPRAEQGEVDRVLRRLDDAALERELARAEEPPGATTEVALRSLSSEVRAATGSLDAETLAPLLDDEMDIATTFLERRAEPPREGASDVLVVSSLDASPPAPVVSAPPAASPAPPSAAPLAHPGVAAPLVAPPPAERPPTVASWPFLLRAVGAVLALGVGIPIGMWLVESARAPEPPATTASTSAVAAAPPGPASETAPATSRPGAITPASLPDAPSPSVAAPPPVESKGAEPPVWTPSALPDAPSPGRRVGGAR